VKNWSFLAQNLGKLVKIFICIPGPGNLVQIGQKCRISFKYGKNRVSVGKMALFRKHRYQNGGDYDEPPHCKMALFSTFRRFSVIFSFGVIFVIHGKQFSKTEFIENFHFFGNIFGHFWVKFPSIFSSILSRYKSR
jgi:hypothetical protein